MSRRNLTCLIRTHACHDRGVRIRARPKSFLDASRRDWQFDVFAWLLRNSSGYPKFLETTLVLPTAEHFPDHDMGGHAAAAALFRRVRDHAGMADWPCAVEPDADARVSRGSFLDASRVPVIRYVPTLAPTSLAATFAHELARYLVETFEEPAPGGAPLHEPAVDVAAVFMGFGLFMANAAIESASFESNEGELAHALALFCILRKLPPESIDRHLNPHLRKYLRLAARDLAQYDTKFQRLRSVFAVLPLEFVERTLPIKAR